VEVSESDIETCVNTSAPEYRSNLQ
jgi:hypothetical protein